MSTAPASGESAGALAYEVAGRPTQNRWATTKEGKAAAKELGIRFDEFRTTLAADFLDAWLVACGQHDRTGL